MLATVAIAAQYLNIVALWLGMLVAEGLASQPAVRWRRGCLSA